MPARKPSDLIERHETAAEIAQRAERDAALHPRRSLPSGSPAQLRGHTEAQAIWRRVMRIYGELEAEIVTRLDLDLLVDYCILGEQVSELDKMRRSAYEVWELASQAFDEFEGPLDERIKSGLTVQSTMTDAVKLDGRVDRKRALLLQWRQSLYLTPRSRSGTPPKPKEQEQPKDDLEKLLDDVTDYVNGPKP